MNNAYLIIGGNLGDRSGNLKKCLVLIEERVGTILKTSAIYESEAWGANDQPDFLNQVIIVETNLQPQKLLEYLLSIELSMGRTTKGDWKQRIIDIDILFYNSEIIETDNLTIPHPHIQNRKFVLIPLKEVEKDMIHPVFKKNIETLFLECKDALNVRLYKDSVF